MNAKDHRKEYSDQNITNSPEDRALGHQNIVMKTLTAYSPVGSEL
jgi:hypothetical protein